MSTATHCIPWDETCFLCNPSSGDEKRIEKLQAENAALREAPNAEEVDQALGEMWEKSGEWSEPDRIIMRRVLETFLASRAVPDPAPQHEEK